MTKFNAKFRFVLSLTFLHLSAVSHLLGQSPTKLSEGYVDRFGYFRIKVQGAIEEQTSRQRAEKIRLIPANLFEPHEFEAGNKVKIAYRLLKPENYQPRVKYPLIVVLHGSGAIGNDNEKQLGIFAKSWAQDEYRQKYPSFVLVPQFASRSVKYDKGSEGGSFSQPLPPLLAALELIESIQNEFSVDKKRIYIMGFSMGGSSVLNALFLKPKMFAAAICIAPVPNSSKAKKIRNLPLWIIHGNKDTENKFEDDQKMYEALKQVGARKIRFSEFDGVAHEVPMQIFDNDEIPKWLFDGYK